MLDSLNDSSKRSKRRDRRNSRQRSLCRIEEVLSKIEERDSNDCADMIFPNSTVFDWGLELSPGLTDDSESGTVGTCALDDSNYDLETVSGYAFEEGSHSLDGECDGSAADAAHRHARGDGRRGGSADRVLINVVEYKIVGDYGRSNTGSASSIEPPPKSLLSLAVGMVLGIFMVTALVTIIGVDDPILNPGLLHLRGRHPVVGRPLDGGDAANNATEAVATNVSAASDAASDAAETVASIVAPRPRAAPADAEPNLADFCGTCQWKHQSFDCDKRVEWEMERYGMEETEAKLANLPHCVELRVVEGVAP